jgi:hypothetical protein
VIARGQWLSVFVALGMSGCSCFVPVGENDGGALTRPCPLTEGVCAGAFSRFVDGQWTVCEYGPNYQLTERKCDGLDNDCDGRVDVSWARVLLDVDAGRMAPDMKLRQGDCEQAQFIKVAGGFWVSLPNDLLMLNDELEVVGRTPFPVTYNGMAYLFRDGSDWVRFSYDFPVFSRPPCATAHRVFGDGGYPELADGGVDSIGQRCASRPQLWQWGFAAAEVPGGWVTFIKDVDDAGTLFLVSWFGADGGRVDARTDAGSLAEPYRVWITEAGEGAVVYQHDDAIGWKLTGPPAQLTELYRRSGEACSAATIDPLTVSCPAAMGIRRWYSTTGLLLTAPFIGEPVHTVGRRGSPLAMVYRPSENDSGVPGVPVGDLFALRDGGLSFVAKLGPAPLAFTVRAADLGPEPTLVSWAETQSGGVCPNCTIDSFNVAYICVP